MQKTAESWWGVLALGLGAFACAADPERRASEHPQTAARSLASEPSSEAAFDEVARTPHFVFHANELLNLHHFLYQWAKTEARRAGESVSGRPVEVLEAQALDALGGREGALWHDAVAFYRREAISKDLLFDGDLYRLKGQLAELDGLEEPWPDDLDDGFAEALQAALPIYRERFWPAHRARIRDWVAEACSGLERYGDTVLTRVTDAFGGAWPETPMRVDLCVYANWAGAYTSGDPNHIVQSVGGATHSGLGALETLAHEATHTSEIFGAFRGELASTFESRGEAVPRNLWHLFIFMTAGEAVARALAADGRPGYEPYGQRTGLYSRGSWAEEYPSAIGPWRAYLDGDIDRAEALARIAEALGAAE